MTIGRCISIWLRSLALACALFATPAAAQNVFFPANPGDMIVKGATTWGPVPGGTAGCVLMSQGPTAAPTWSCALPLNFSLPPMPTNTVWGNVSGVQAVPSAINVSQFLDTVGYDVARTPVSGSLIYKDPTTGTWQSLPPSPNVGWVLASAGTGQVPQWAAGPFVPVGAITVGDTIITAGTPLGILYNDNGVLGNTGAVANAMLVTDGSGNPSLSSTLPSGITLPSGLTINSPTITNPTLTGTAVAPTAAFGTNDTTIATTAWVQQLLGTTSHLSVLTYIAQSEWAAIANCTTTTDLTTQLNTAIAAANGRALFWPKGCYQFASQIGAASLNNTQWYGEGGIALSYAGNNGTVLRFTGTGAGVAISTTDHRGMWISDMQITYTSNSFTGTLWDMSSSFTTGNGSGFNRVAMYQHPGNNHTAAELIYLKNNVDVTYNNMYMAHAQYGWVGLRSSEVGTPHTNMIKINDSTAIALKGASAAAVLNPDNGWSIKSTNFEPSDTNAPAGILCNGTWTIQNLNLYGVVFADSSANGTWIDCPRPIFNFGMYGGAILGLSATVTGARLGNTFSAGITFSGVDFNGVTTGINLLASTQAFTATANNFLSVTTPITGTGNIGAPSCILANNASTGIMSENRCYGSTNTVLDQAAQTSHTVTNTNASTSASAAIRAISNSGTMSISAANNPNTTGQAGATWTGAGGFTFNATTGPLIFSTNSFTERLRIDGVGHFKPSAGTPALSSCGTSPSITGNDVYGVILTGTGTPTGCTVTFASAYAAAPSCTLSWRTNLASMSYTTSTSALTITQTATSNSIIDYKCFGL